MKRSILGKLALAVMMVAALACGVSANGATVTTVTTGATGATSADFDCTYGVKSAADTFLTNTSFGATEIVTYTEAEATEAGIPAGFSGDVLSVLHTRTNRGVVLDFSAKKIPIQLVDSITFRVYMGDDGIPTDGYPELRIPQPNTTDRWVMRYSFATKTDAWQDVVLKEGNGSFYTLDGRTADFSMLAKDGYLYKLELAMRHNGSNATFYVDSVKVGYVENDGVAPVLKYNGEDVVTVPQGQTLSFDVSAVDAIEGAVDVEYVWADPSKIEADGTPMAGTHTLTFVARDLFGNVAEKTITVVVVERDLIPPTLIVPIDTVYAKIGARCLLTFTAYDENGTAEVTLSWSEGAVDRYERLKEGTHTLTVTATDLSGNQTHKTITFIVTAEGDSADTVIDEEELCNPQIPEDSEIPETSEKPEDSEIPETSEKPEDSEKPETSEKPEDSEIPETSEKPENSEIPEVSEKPETSDKQESAGNSESTAKTGCGSTLATMAGLPLLAFVACALLKKKEN